MTRIGLVIAHRDFRFGDPYFRCPECGEQTFYDGNAGECYACRVPFTTTKVKEPAKPNYRAISIALFSVAAILWLTAPDKPKP